MPPFVGVLGAPHAGKHAEGPVLSPVPRDLVSPKIGELAGIADVPGEIHVLDVFRTIETLDLQVGDGGPSLSLVRPLGDGLPDLVFPFFPHFAGLFQQFLRKVHVSPSFQTLSVILFSMAAVPFSSTSQETMPIPGQPGNIHELKRTERVAVAPCSP